MVLDLLYLGSDELYTRIINDLKDILSSTTDQGYIPIQIGLGKIFLQMSCCRSVMEDFNITNWDKICESNYEDLYKLFYERYLEVISSISDKDGFVGDRENVMVYFDPDEPYISIYATDPTEKAIDTDRKTKDGHPIYKFSCIIDENPNKNTDLH